MNLSFPEDRSALLIVDMINSFEFEHGLILAKKAEVVAQTILQLKSLFKRKGLPVIYANDHYQLWVADVQRIIDFCKNERSRNVINAISPTHDDYFLMKPKHSAFYGTALNTLLHQLNIDKLVITGIAGNICVLFTANDAYMREYAIHVPQNAIASVSEQDNEYALTMISHVLKGDISPLA